MLKKIASFLRKQLSCRFGVHWVYIGDIAAAHDCPDCNKHFPAIRWSQGEPNDLTLNGKKIEKAIQLAVEYGGIDGTHHKDWVIDQLVRILASDSYDQVVADAKSGKDGPETFSWDCGIAP